MRLRERGSLFVSWLSIWKHKTETFRACLMSLVSVACFKLRLALSTRVETLLLKSKMYINEFNEIIYLQILQNCSHNILFISKWEIKHQILKLNKKLRYAPDIIMFQFDIDDKLWKRFLILFFDTSSHLWSSSQKSYKIT